VALKDQLRKFIDDEGSGPNRKALAEYVLTEADDEETAGNLLTVIRKLFSGESKDK
jgi:hypothetical protein